jgi:predicted nucleic acid-binding protein
LATPSRPADADDDYLLAQPHDADVLVSGDPHLRDADSSELQVLTPRELADRLRLTPVG